MSAGASGEAVDVVTTWMEHRDRCPVAYNPEVSDSACTCRVRDIALAIDALVQRKVKEETERCCRAVCQHCAEGNKPQSSRDYNRKMHLFQGYPPRLCAAHAIRTTQATRG